MGVFSAKVSRTKMDLLATRRQEHTLVSLSNQNGMVMAENRPAFSSITFLPGKTGVGNWSDGDFAEGIIHSVLFHKAENGELEPFAGDICGFMTADRIDHSFYHEDDPSSYYLGDVHYDHGDCELIDSSVQPIETILGYSD